MRFLSCAATAALVTIVASTASAHVSLSTPVLLANKSQKITFGIGHGCEGLDTFRITVDVPADVTSLRGLKSDLGVPTITTDVDGTHVTWEKAVEDVRDGDDQYYEVTLRAKLPNTPFTQLQWNVHQVCLDADDNEVLVDWDDAPGEGANEAPIMTLLPQAKLTGWNKFTMPAAIAQDDVPKFFGDAQIVWSGTEAYSANPAVVEMIAATAGVTPMTSGLASGAVVWVKY